MPKKTKESAGKRIANQGRSLIWVAPTDDEKKQIRIAAAILGVSMGKFLLDNGLRHAEEIIKKDGK